MIYILYNNIFYIVITINLIKFKSIFDKMIYTFYCINKNNL